MNAVLPLHLSAARPSLDPYGHLLRMLVPRASGIVFYDGHGTPLWVSDGYDGPDPAPVVEQALARIPPATTAQIDGFALDFEGAPSYAFRLRDDRGLVIAVAVLLTRDGERRPYSFVHHLVHPALECLQRELAARTSLGTMVRDLQTRDEDLDLLLKVAPDEPQNPAQADELGAIVQTCVDHLGCVLGALVVPERNVAICKAPASGRPQLAILTATHRHLMNWATLQRRSLTINKVNGAAGLPAYKILCMPVRHASGRVTGFLALFRAPEEADFDLRVERLSELLARKVTSVLQNNFDAATSLLTRGAFEVQVRAALAGVSGDGESCVLYLDVDRLHVVNDNFGMHVGDEVIGKIAEVLRRKPRSGALASRVAGDRFAVFLPDCSLESATQVAESICRQCAELSYPRGDGTVQVSVSIGVAALAEGANSLAHGMASAEIACKAAKDRGRNRAEIFQDADQSIIRRHSDVQVVQRLHEALQRDRFVLYAQPILPLAEGRGDMRFELLLRMVGESGEALPPEKFLSAAERYQMLPQIDRWVVSRALAALKSHRSSLAGRPLKFSINVSGPSVVDPGFHDFLEQSIRESGVSADMLCFELTETAAVSDLARADRLMQRIRGLGASFALDDFGTGLSSLAYLRSLPVSVLKIDGSFVRDAASNQRSESMVRAIAQLAHTMGMETVAEFVETDELRIRMAALGVDYGQGFAIGRPQPLAEVLSDLALYEVMAAQGA
ncbi:MAG: EAL domain-containing protein [Steroidobacteraceae bacterium]|jgi:diguanylate cyclase (GGDEF)-like protein|nr:EAL domain-containing protein [Steroidobacteraceae bacterium]